MGGASGGGVSWNSPVKMAEGIETNPGDRDYTLVDVPDYLIGGDYVGSRPWPKANSWSWTVTYTPPVNLYVWAASGENNAGVDAALKLDGWSSAPAPGFHRSDGKKVLNDLNVWNKNFTDGSSVPIQNLSGLLVGGAVSICPSDGHDVALI